jgi:preprotein translocase subunit SecE
VVSDARGVTQGKGRATPGRRTQVDEEEEGNVATRTFGGIREYFEGVQSELGKVAWPTREETLRLTGIVLTALVICAIVLGIIGLIYTEIFRIGLDLPIIFVAIVVGAIAVTVFVFWRSNRRSSSPF